MPDPKTRPTTNTNSTPYRYEPRPLSGTKKLWFQQPGESVQAYQAFMTFLMAEPDDRTLNKTAKTLNKSFSLMAKWSACWSWRLRVSAYEEHYLLIRLESVAAERDRMWLEQKSISDVALSVVQASLCDLVEQIDPQTGRLNSIKPDALVRLLDIATKIQRMAVLGRAQNAEEVQQRNEKLTDQWSEELAETLQSFMNEMQLTPQQQELAKEALEKALIGTTDADDS